MGTDEPSEHIDELLFDGLVKKNAQFQFHAGAGGALGTA